MKKMTAINIDKWRTLNEDLFKGYVFTYNKLSRDNELNPNETLVEVFNDLGILGSLTKDGYGSAYTIAREIGVYYEDSGNYILSNMAKSYIEGKLTYSDFLKYYCLNIEFLINDEVIHPFKEVLEVLKGKDFDKQEISQRVPKLIPINSNSSAIDCLRLFLNRCVEAELLKKEENNYSLNYNYNILKGSLNISDCTAVEFENNFIKGSSDISQKNIVNKLIEREITNLFKHSFYIKKNELQSEKSSLDLFSNVDNISQKKNLLNSFITWFAKLEGKTHNYLKDSFSDSVVKLKESLLNYEELYKHEFNSNVFTFDSENKDFFIKNLEKNLYKEDGVFFEFSSKKSNHMPRAILGKKNYLQFLKQYLLSETNIEQEDFNISSFYDACNLSGLKYLTSLITRYISSLATKPFVLLSGLSGSGKTKLAQCFAQWICEDTRQYCIVPVGADWTNREPLLGYANALNPLEYVIPDNKALQLIIDANKIENENKPYFLILDEMNLSHVERYFADFLSVMESKDEFKLHNGSCTNVPKTIKWPDNLFVVGTVNIDETTYMFSPKVLDRANVIEFRVDENEIEDFLNTGIKVTAIKNNGQTMASSFVAIAKEKETNADFTNLNTELLDFFKELQVLGAEFGYRTATEIQTLFSKIDAVNPDYSTKENEKIDIAIMQKLLPKLHGSRRKLLKTLNLLANKCLEKEQVILFNDRGEYTITEGNNIKYNLSFGKIARMYKNAIENGFASYAEA
jgi:MoxR-like ATPase